MKNCLKQYLLILSMVTIVIDSYAQHQGNVLFLVDEDPVYSDEFEYVYRKNNLNNDNAFSQDDIEEYLDLFINFKLKVKEARTLGYDTTKAYQEELNQYRDQLTQPYLTEKEVTEGLLVEAYERMQFQIDVSHILVIAGPEASPDDTLKAYEKIQSIHELATRGTDFGELAVKYSEEPMIDKTKGHLGYFTALQMVYPFENMAYNTPFGEVSPPFRTRFGYHVLKVHDKRPNKGKVQISHLMLRMDPSMTNDDSVRLRNKIFELYEQASSGYDWDQLCKEYSEDLNTKNSGGNLSPFGVGEMIPSIAEAAFNLSGIGDISDPVQTDYGWHILKLNEVIPLPTFDEYKAQLTRRIQRDSRSEKSKEVLINRLKLENGFKENLPLKSSLLAKIDSTTFSGNWRPELDDSESEVLFWIADSAVMQAKFVEFVNQNYRKANSGHPSIKINNLYQLFTEEALVEYEKLHLEEKYDDYRYLIREYREGILLFEIMEDKVWGKSGVDSVGLARFYQDNLTAYKVKQSGSLIIFDISNGQNTEELLSRLNMLVSDTTSTPEIVRDLIAAEFKQAEVREFLSRQEFDSEWDDIVSQGEGVFPSENGERITVVMNYTPATIPPLEDIKGLVISDYQDHLDKEWIASLRKKYKVKINKKELNKLYKNLVQ